MSEELKPCPFCGKAQPKGHTRIAAYSCLANKEHFWTIPAEIWNTRPIEDALRAENAKLKARVEAAEEVFRKQKIYKSYFRNGQLDAHGLSTNLRSRVLMTPIMQPSTNGRL